MTPNTQLCISIAQRPGRGGITVHNAGYRALGLDFLYKACAVADLAGAMAGVRALGIRGASIAMPFKEEVMGFLDALDASAREVGAVNTVVNEAGQLKGYNTDVLAARAALSRVGFVPTERVLLLGAGGVARAVRSALTARGATDVHVSSRTLERTRSFVAGTSMTPLAWEARASVKPALVINATPLGMSPDEAATPLESEALAAARALVEIVAVPTESRLLREARALQLVCSSGLEFSLDQAVAQFELYTGVQAPREAMEVAQRSLI